MFFFFIHSSFFCYFYYYKIFNHNRYHCGDLVNDTMEAGGLPIGAELPGNPPNVAFDRNRSANAIK